MNKEQLENYLKQHEVKCPECKSKNIGIDNWGIFDDNTDWFYFCKECDSILRLESEE